MAITNYDNKEAGGGKVVTPGRRLWLDTDRKRLLEDGHPDARYLFCHPHHRVSQAALDELGDPEPVPAAAKPAKKKAATKKAKKKRAAKKKAKKKGGG